jgi:lipid II:glycine glycyltransferase (peptidoglycan interpeptide bridge formation enzyme)
VPGPGETTLQVVQITEDQHREFLARQPWASFLQTPAWGPLKTEWRRDSIGWTREGDGKLLGAGLVLHRPIPRQRRYTLAYLAEGPVIDWNDPDLRSWLDPLAAYLKAKGAFGIRMGPPVVTRRWSAEQVKAGIADPDVHRLRDIEPMHEDPVGSRVVAQLESLGWRAQYADDGFGSGQPQYNFEVPLVDTDPDGGPVRRTPEDVLRGMNQQWRRNIKKADKAGVDVFTADVTSAPTDMDAALREFHDLYVLTAERDGFTPRPLPYFQRMFGAMSAEDPDRIRLFLARHEGDLVAATIMVRVGVHTWYAYGASSTEKRDVRGSNAVQWAMMRSAIDAGAEVYDLRGITNTLDAEDSHVGLIQFKVGTGGQAVEYAGEWDLPLNRLLYAAFDLYMRRR